MKTRRRTRQASRKAVLSASAVAAVLAGLSIWSALALWSSDGDPGGEASDFASGSLAAASTAAEQHLSDNDASGAMVFADKALRISPISVRPLRVMALSQLQLGKTDQASSLLGAAAALGWRDSQTQSLLAISAQSAGQPEVAAQHVDALMRVSGGDDGGAGHVADLMLADPKVRVAIAERMVLNPPWRRFFFTHADDVPPAELPMRAAVLRDLMNSAAPPIDDETVPIAKAMFRNDMEQLSRHFWFQTHPGVGPGPVVDPNFRNVRAGASNYVPFEWQLNVPAEIAPLPGSNGQTALHAVVPGHQQAKVIATQLMTLTPGTYTLTVTQGARSAPQGSVAWAVICGSSAGLVFSPLTTGQTLSESFVIPQKCPRQQLNMVTREASAGGEAWITGVSIAQR
jgi:hypothetical protein